MNVVNEDLGKANFFNDSRDITMVELGRDDVTVSLTPGKIILWFGRQVSEIGRAHV
jgi:beta-galactosidase beta subunit